MKIQHRRAQGFSLIELMVGITLGLFLMLGVVSASTSLLTGTLAGPTKLDSELSNAAFLLTRDLARSGYQGNALTAMATAGAATYVNPFSTIDVSTPGCIGYSYDLNSNGTQETGTTDERFAMALSNKVLFMRMPGGAYSCDTTVGNWSALTDASLISVTAFTTTLTDVKTPVSGSTKFVHSRSVSYVITGALKATPTKTQTLRGTVRLQNDVFF